MRGNRALGAFDAMAAAFVGKVLYAHPRHRALARKADRVGAPHARVGPEFVFGFRLAVGLGVDRPIARPHVEHVNRIGRTLGADDLGHARSPLAQGRRDAVDARVAAANDHDVLAGGGDRRRLPAQEGAGRLCQVVERIDDTGQVDARHVDGARRPGAARDDHGRRCLLDFGRAGCGIHRRLEDDSALFHEFDAAGDDVLVELHVGNAVHEQAARAIGALDYLHARPASGELPGSRQAGRPRPDHAHERRLSARSSQGLHQAVGPRVVAHGTLVVVDGHRLFVQAQVAGHFAGSRAHAPREFGKGIGKRQALVGVLQAAAVEQVVHFGQTVVQGAAGRAALARKDHARLAKGHATGHAAARLGLLRLERQRHDELVEIGYRIGARPHPVVDAVKVEIRSGFAHPTHLSSWFRRRFPPLRRAICPRLRPGP